MTNAERPSAASAEMIEAAMIAVEAHAKDHWKDEEAVGPWLRGAIGAGVDAALRLLPAGGEPREIDHG